MYAQGTGVPSSGWNDYGIPRGATKNVEPGHLVKKCPGSFWLFPDD